MDKFLSSDVFNNIKIDTAKVGLAQATQQLGENRSLASLTDATWLKKAVLTLVGFAVYNLIVANVVSTGGLKDVNIKMAVDDILKVGTMLIVRQFLLEGYQGLHREWMQESAYILIGFMVYDFAVSKFIDTQQLEMSGTISRAGRISINDALKFGTMFTVSRFLEGKAFDTNYILGSAGFIAGLVAYNYLLAGFVENK